jgi:hypothetical protein
MKSKPVRGMRHVDGVPAVVASSLLLRRAIAEESLPNES